MIAISILGGVATLLVLSKEIITISRDYFNPWYRFKIRETFDKNPSTFSSATINTL